MSQLPNRRILSSLSLMVFFCSPDPGRAGRLLSPPPTPKAKNGLKAAVTSGLAEPANLFHRKLLHSICRALAAEKQVTLYIARGCST